MYRHSNVCTDHENNIGESVPTQKFGNGGITTADYILGVVPDHVEKVPDVKAGEIWAKKAQQKDLLNQATSPVLGFI